MMKLMNSIIVSISLVSVAVIATAAAPAFADATSTLFVKDGTNLIDVETMIESEVDVQTDYGFEDFCYRGNSFAVVKKMKAWYKTDFFFSGGGGGFVLRDLKINRGFATYDIAMTLEDEVVPGEFKNVVIKPCDK